MFPVYLCLRIRSEFAREVCGRGGEPKCQSVAGRHLLLAIKRVRSTSMEQHH